MSKLAQIFAAWVAAETAIDRGERPQRSFLTARGWLPLGMGSNGYEGWGKVIDGKAVCVDEPEALAMEGWQR